MRGLSVGSAERSSTVPRLSGRSWQTEAVKPEKRCSGVPGRSAENSTMWNWTSGVASSARVRAKIAALAGADGQRAGAVEQPLEPHQRLLEGALDAVVERDRLGAAIDRARLEVVLQVVPDARQLVHDLDAVLAQVLGRPDARELEELRRVDGAAGEHDLARARRRSARGRSGGSARPRARRPSKMIARDQRVGLDRRGSAAASPGADSRPRSSSAGRAGWSAGSSRHPPGRRR